jgi:PEP-CTERM motif
MFRKFAFFVMFLVLSLTGFNRVHAATAVSGAARCNGGTFVESSTIDYTIPATGTTSIFSFAISPEGDVTFNGRRTGTSLFGPFLQTDCIFVSGPTQLDRIDFFRDANGFFDVPNFEPFDVTFIPTVLPGLTNIIVGGPLSFFRCNEPGPIGELCGVRYNIFGNASSIEIFRSTVPEPESWAMLLLGFGLIGMMARRRRVVRTAIPV